MSLSPVPEALEGDEEEAKDRDSSTNEVSASVTKPPSQPPAAVHSRGAMRPANSSTSTLGSQHSSITDSTKKGKTFD